MPDRAPIDLVEGRDYTVSRRPAAGNGRVSSNSLARVLARPGKPGKARKPPKLRFTTRDPLTMAAVGLAALALDWWLNPAEDDPPELPDLDRRRPDGE